MAHAAGLGTAAGWIALYEWFQRSSHDVRQNDSAFFIACLLGILMCLACLQQLMLRSAGWSAPLWAVCTMLGLLAGGFAGAVAGTTVGHIRDFSSYPPRYYLLLGMLVAAFVGGCVLGAVQFLLVHSDRRKHVAWIIVSGLAVLSATASQVLLSRLTFLGPEKLITASTVFGGCYGAITGAALIYLLAGERRHHGLVSLPGSE